MQREHSEIGVSPAGKWESTGFIPRLPDSLEQLDLLLLTVAKTRKVQRDGIHFSNMRYASTALDAFVGESVVIRYDPRDLARLKVYFQDEYVCTAICHDLTNATMDLKDLIKTRNRRRKKLEREINARSNVVKLYMDPSSSRFREQGSEEDTSASGISSSRAHSGSSKQTRLKLYASDRSAAKAEKRSILSNE